GTSSLHTKAFGKDSLASKNVTAACGEPAPPSPQSLPDRDERRSMRPHHTPGANRHAVRLQGKEIDARCDRPTARVAPVPGGRVRTGGLHLMDECTDATAQHVENADLHPCGGCQY